MATVAEPGTGKRDQVRGRRSRHTHSTAPFSVRQARLIIQDDFVRQPWVYWADLLITLAVSYSCASAYLTLGWSAPGLACFLVAGFGLFRAGSFIHEIAHMRHGEMLGFKVFWNLSVGVPLLMPSYLYDCHIDHHAIPHYGTRKDGEYLPLGAGPVARIFFYLCQILVIPLFSVFRFLLTPLTFIHPSVRQWTLERASSYVMNPWYRREIPESAPRKVWALVDFACFVRVLPMIGLVLLGFKPVTHWVQLYCLAIFVIGLNWTRNLVAHHYSNEDGEELSHVQQLTDSINITGGPLLTELLFPLGLRYHALHHLFPGVPYHALGRAHRRLMAELPADSAYRGTVRPSFYAAWKELLRNARIGARRRAARRR